MLAPLPALCWQTQPQTPARTPAACAGPRAPARWALAPLGAASSTGALPTKERRTPRWSSHALSTRDLQFNVPRSLHSDRLHGFVYAATSSLCFIPSGIALGPASSVFPRSFCWTLLVNTQFPCSRCVGLPGCTAACSSSPGWGIGWAAAAASLRCRRLTAF